MAVSIANNEVWKCCTNCLEQFSEATGRNFGRFKVDLGKQCARMAEGDDLLQQYGKDFVAAFDREQT